MLNELFFISASQYIHRQGVYSKPMRSLFFLMGVLGLSFTSIQAGNFKVNNQYSEVSVDCRATPPHTVTSYVRKYDCDIQIDPVELQVTSAQFSFKLIDLDSEHEKRDKKMHSWIDMEHFPEITFSLTNINNTENGNKGEGTLTMHGVSKTIEVPFTLAKNGDTIQLDGNATFSYEDWGLEIIRLFLFRVRPELNVKFHLEGSLQGS